MLQDILYSTRSDSRSELIGRINRAQATMWREWHAGLDQLRPLNQYEIDTLGWLANLERN